MAQRVEPAVGGRSGGRDDEQPIELRRHLDALRRGRWVILGLVVVMTGIALALSLVLPKVYQANARILYDPTVNPLASQDPNAVQRELHTDTALLVTPEALGPVAQRFGLGERALEQKVKASVDSTANMINVTAKTGDPDQAARIANAVAATFLERQKTRDAKTLHAARANLQEEIVRVRGTANSAPEIAALQQRLSDLSIAEATAGSEFSVAEAARPPTGPASPRPVRNAVLALFAALFIGVLVVLGRDQLVPRINGPRELARITDRPTIAAVPYVRRRWGRAPKVLGAVEHEAYQTLQASLRFQLPAQETHIILVTSAVEGEGKTTLTTNLGRALARSGRKTLLISADMRKPKLHENFGMAVGPGLAEVLTALERGGNSAEPTLAAARALLVAQTGAKGKLHVLPAGKKPDDAARLLLSPGLLMLFDELRAMEYDYVLLDGTPLLGIADSQALAQRVDDVLVVSRLDRITAEDAIDVRELLDRLDVSPIGFVVIGTRRGVSYSYATADLG